MLVGKECVCDKERIHACVIGLLATSSDEVVACELVAYPPSMFNTDGEIKITKSKLILTQKLQVAISEHNCPTPNTMIYDLHALL